MSRILLTDQSDPADADSHGHQRPDDRHAAFENRLNAKVLLIAWCSPQPFDVVFSNAALQWLPDHAAIVARLFDQVAPGGALAMQIPSYSRLPVRMHIHEISHDPTWSHRLDAARSALTMEAPEFYYDVLSQKAERMDVWETAYFHVMPDAGAIVDWISSTGLRPFLDALANDADRERFLTLLRERVAGSYPQRSDGKVLFPFKRLFVIAYRSVAFRSAKAAVDTG